MTSEFFKELRKQMMKGMEDEGTDRNQVGKGDGNHPQGNHHDGGIDDSRCGGRDM